VTRLDDISYAVETRPPSRQSGDVDGNGGEGMIGRVWHRWTSRENADAYEELLRREVLLGIHRVAGYHGAYLLRRDVEEGVQFVTVTFFESLDAVRAFAGPDYEVAVVPPGARRLLPRFDQRSRHYAVIAEPSRP
jgi:heme-degrading monooxygenase HmoA